MSILSKPAGAYSQIERPVVSGQRLFQHHIELITNLTQ